MCLLYESVTPAAGTGRLLTLRCAAVYVPGSRRAGEKTGRQSRFQVRSNSEVSPIGIGKTGINGKIIRPGIYAGSIRGIVEEIIVVRKCRPYISPEIDGSSPTLKNVAEEKCIGRLRRRASVNS